MKRAIIFLIAIITIILLLIIACEKKPTEPDYANPFDLQNEQTGGDPFKLTAKIAGGGCTLDWTKPDFAALQSFKIYRSENETTGYSELGTAAASQNQYVDKTVKNGHSYWYRVTMVNNENKETKMTNTAGVNIKTEPILVINGGEAYTSSREVTLTILANTAQKMILANSADFSGADWENYATSKNWTLASVDGQKKIYLKVKYDTEESCVISDDIIMDTIPPIIAITVIPDSGITNETNFQIDPTASNDNLSPVQDLQVRFDWENNGSYDTEWKQLQITNYLFQIGGGDKTTKMQLKDAAGWQVDTTLNIFVNTHPQASFNASVNNDNYKLHHFDASVSTDYEDGSNLEYRWDFNGDDSWETGWLTQDTISYEYASYGDYIVKLSVRDQNFLTNEITKQIKVQLSVTDIDGNVYEIVKIGNQWWMAENLKVTRYRNGDVIPNVTDNTQWTNLSSGAWCSYNNDDGNINTYGLLYNWYAVNDSRNIAPAGWHVSTDAEWKELEMYLGMSQSDADNTGWRGTDEGGKMKESGTTHWNSPNTGATNESGFSALPGGYRNSDDGTFYGIGNSGYWWSATEYSSNSAWYRDLDFQSSGIVRHGYGKQFGFSVRCVRD